MGVSVTMSLSWYGPWMSADTVPAPDGLIVTVIVYSVVSVSGPM